VSEEQNKSVIEESVEATPPESDGHDDHGGWGSEPDGTNVPVLTLVLLFSVVIILIMSLGVLELTSYVTRLIQEEHNAVPTAEIDNDEAGWTALLAGGEGQTVEAAGRIVQPIGINEAMGLLLETPDAYLGGVRPPQSAEEEVANALGVAVVEAMGNEEEVEAEAITAEEVSDDLGQIEE
jgi:hypothetical protein